MNCEPYGAPRPDRSIAERAATSRRLPGQISPDFFASAFEMSTVPWWLNGIFLTKPLSSSTSRDLVVEVFELAATDAADQAAQAAHEVGRHDHVEFGFAQRGDHEPIAAHAVGEAVAHQDDLVVEPANRQLEVVQVLDLHAHAGISARTCRSTSSGCRAGSTAASRASARTSSIRRAARPS